MIDGDARRADGDARVAGDDAARLGDDVRAARDAALKPRPRRCEFRKVP